MKEQLSEQLIEVGDVFEHSFSFDQEQINLFAEVSGDNNPIHLDSNYAAQTVFKKPIIHGFLGGSVFSKVLGTLFPGEGTIYLKQDMRFTRPMYVGSTYQAVLEVVEVNREKSTALLKTRILDVETGKSTIEGEALVMNKKRL
ncbi:MAG: MaoC family dehydratase [Cytophagales bacterium]|nr:MAG: MaoC family dehydratase [Cytophagales bacterium]TAF61317.1 MAG: MaoC family dehydratase [Cytophagales bacterium]